MQMSICMWKHWNKSWGYLGSSFCSVVNFLTLGKSLIFLRPQISQLRGVYKLEVIISSPEDILVAFLSRECVCVVYMCMRGM